MRRGILLAGLGIAFYTILAVADAAVIREATFVGITHLAQT